ncbi:MAG: hypothetical protein HY825_05280 [Acidobacteria bacterium]|nr:hypothetical protein [Acidobacteriota bacterium]
MAPVHHGFFCVLERFQESPDVLYALESEPSLVRRGEAPWGREIEP